MVYSQTGHIIIVQNFSFSPSSVTINAGDTVIWQRVSGSHTTTSDSTSGPNSWDAVLNSTTQVYRHVITAPGIHRYYCKPHGGPGGSGMSGMVTSKAVTSIDDQNIEKKFFLEPNYPNPFNPSTTFRYFLSEGNIAKLKIFNIIGQEVITLVEDYQPAGWHSIQWNGINSDGKNVQTGIYIFRLQSGNAVQTRKMVLVK